MQLAEFLQNNYPSSIGDISGDNYPPPEYATFLMNIFSVVQMMTLAGTFIGEGIFKMIPFVSQTPQWYFSARENPAFVLMAVFLFIPSMLNSFVVTGAFEILLDGVVIYSKLETGKMPTGPMIMEAFAKAGIKQG